jgi:hypothetical protein
MMGTIVKQLGCQGALAAAKTARLMIARAMIEDGRKAANGTMIAGSKVATAATETIIEQTKTIIEQKGASAETISEGKVTSVETISSRERISAPTTTISRE